MNKKEFLIIAVGIFFTIIAWIIVDVYHINKQKRPVENMTLINVPQYQINKNIIETLLKKTP